MTFDKVEKINRRTISFHNVHHAKFILYKLQSIKKQSLTGFGNLGSIENVKLYNLQHQRCSAATINNHCIMWCTLGTTRYSK